MIVRNFLKEDLPQILELCREVRQHHIDILEGYFTRQNDELEKLGFLESLTSQKTIALVAENNNEILGYLLAEEKFAPYLVAPKVIHITNFGVKKSARRQGIGKILMDTLMEICYERSIDEVRLGVFNKNTQAYKFYENYGFEPFEQRMFMSLKKIG